MASAPPSKSPYRELSRLVATLEVALERMERDGLIDLSPASAGPRAVVLGYQEAMAALAAHWASEAYADADAASAQNGPRSPAELELGQPLE